MRCTATQCIIESIKIVMHAHKYIDTGIYDNFASGVMQDIGSWPAPVRALVQAREVDAADAAAAEAARAAEEAEETARSERHGLREAAVAAHLAASEAAVGRQGAQYNAPETFGINVKF